MHTWVRASAHHPRPCGVTCAATLWVCESAWPGHVQSVVIPAPGEVHAYHPSISRRPIMERYVRIIIAILFTATGRFGITYVEMLIKIFINFIVTAFYMYSTSHQNIDIIHNRSSWISGCDPSNSSCVYIFQLTSFSFKVIGEYHKKLQLQTFCWKKNNNTVINAHTYLMSSLKWSCRFFEYVDPCETNVYIKNDMWNILICKLFIKSPQWQFYKFRGMFKCKDGKALYIIGYLEYINTKTLYTFIMIMTCFMPEPVFILI